MGHYGIPLQCRGEPGRRAPLYSELIYIGFEGRSLVYTRYRLEEGAYVPTFHYDGGILYYTQLFYLISFSPAVEVLLLLKFIGSKGKVRKQALYVFLGSLVPTANILIFPERMGGGFDTQPFALGVMGIFISISLFRYEMFDVLKPSRGRAERRILGICRDYQ